MLEEIKKTAEQKMQKSLEALRNDLAKVRTGRAHTGLLDHAYWAENRVYSVGFYDGIGAI